MANLPTYDKETENFSRIYCLLNREGTEAMKRFFLNHSGIRPVHLQELLNDNRDKLIGEIKPAILTKAQKKLLFPFKGKADINKFDITLLFILIKHLCNFNITELQWNDMSGDSALANIIRLKNFRNAKAHSPCYRLSQSDFRNEWIRLSKILQVLGIDKKVIDIYLHQDISVTDQQKFIEEIRKHEEQMKEMFESVNKGMETVCTTVTTVSENNESAFKEINSKLDKLLDGQQKMKSLRTGEDITHTSTIPNLEENQYLLGTQQNVTKSKLCKETYPHLNYKADYTGNINIDKENITILLKTDSNQSTDVKQTRNNSVNKDCSKTSEINQCVVKHTDGGVLKYSKVVEGTDQNTSTLDCMAKNLSLLVHGQQDTQTCVQNLTGEVMNMKVEVVNIKETLENICPSDHRIKCEDDALLLCFNAVRQHYLQTRNQIQLLPWDRSDIVSMDTLFTNLSMVVDLLEPNEQLKIPLKSYHDIFRKDTNGVPVTRVLGYGRAGIGKSTLINKMAYDWANENADSPIKRFKLVIALSMQKISPDEDLVEAMFKHGILTEEYLIYKSILHRFVMNHPEEVAVLLDACDEYKPQSIESPDNGEILKLLENKHLRSSFVVVTSRPWRVDEFKNNRGIYLHCELQGFSKENVKSYVHKFFLRDADRGEALIRYLQNNGLISGIATLPMMTMILCWLWKDNVSMRLPETLSELYDKLLKYMFKRHIDKDTENTEQLTRYLNKVVKIIGRVGLDGLFNNRTLLFRESDFHHSAKMEGSTSKKTVAIACKIGLLMKDTNPGIIPHEASDDEDADSDEDCFFSTKKPEVGILFFHKTAQEKCAALFAGKLARHNQNEFMSYLHRISSIKDALQFDIFLLFLCGTNIKVARFVLKHLLEIFEGELLVSSDRYVSGNLPFQDSMAFQQYLGLCIRCYHESNCSGSLNDIMSVIFKQRHIRFSNFSPTTSNSLGYLLKCSKPQNGPNLNIYKIELMNMRIQTNKEVSTLWEMFPDDHQEFIRKVKRYSQMPPEKLQRKLKECQVETLPPAFQQFPAYQCLSFMRTFQITNEHRGDDTDIKPIVEALQCVNINEITILGFDLITMRDVLPNALRKSSLTVLNLSSANVGPEVCRTLAESLQKTPNLNELILKNNPIGDGIGFLADVFEFIEKLENLNISYSPVSEDGMYTLSLNIHRLRLLKKLSIYQLFNTGSDNFARAIQGMEFLTLLTLPLQGMSASEAFRTVQRACKCPHLVELKITDMTECCDDMISCAADNLTDIPNLKILSLYGKRDEGKIEKIEKECTVTDGACDALVRMLQRIGSLERLQIVSVWMSCSGLSEVAAACEKHPHLQTFRYSGECVPSGMNTNNFKKIQIY